MHYSPGKLTKALLASAVSAALVFSATGPALAGPDKSSRSSATSAPRAEARSYSAPRAEVRTYSAPAPRAEVRTYSAPRAEVRTYTAPAPRAEVRTYSAPRVEVRTYSAPRAEVRTYSAPRVEVRRYSAPREAQRVYAAPRVQEHRMYSAPREAQRVYAAPRVQEHRMYVSPRETQRVYAAPRVQEHRMYTAPRSFAERTFAPKRTIQAHYVRSFTQYAAPQLATRRHAEWTRDRAVIASPLVRAVYASHPYRERTQIAYHPAYLTGRVVRYSRNEVVLAPPTGPQVIVYGNTPPSYVVNQYVTVPAVYNNGGYYQYPYATQFYPQVQQVVSNLFGVPVSYVNGYYVPQGVSYNAPYFANYNNSYNTNCGDEDGDEYGGCGYGNSYDNYGYGQTPYDNCMWTTDAYGNGYCAPIQAASYNSYPNYGYTDPYANYGAPYGGYGNYGAYGLQQVQGIVIAKTGSMLMLLDTNGMKPVIVNDQFAQQSGYQMNGPVAAGQVIDAYGFYNGNTFVATALM